MAGSGRPSALHTSPTSPRGSSSFDGANSVQNGLMLSTAVSTCPASVGRTGGKLVGDRNVNSASRVGTTYSCGALFAAATQRAPSFAHVADQSARSGWV